MDGNERKETVQERSERNVSERKGTVRIGKERIKTWRNGWERKETVWNRMGRVGMWRNGK